MTAGRNCPADYRYPPTVFRREPDFRADILYAAGGLYGNLAAFDEIERMAAAETAPVSIVFNGDFHWFDAQPEWFAQINARISQHRALRGNVETEIARPDDIGAGCGCAYPENVSDGIVTRSNEILADLRRVARGIPGVAVGLMDLPMHFVAEVGGRRVGIVHGDPWSLAGWRFAQDALDDPAARGDLESLRDQTDIGIFASTHTCLAALRRIDTPHGPLSIINNGAAGMPNFRRSTCGLISRIAPTPSPHDPLYGLTQNGLHIDALPVAYDQDAFLLRFLARWPDDTPAHVSYFQRIMAGPDYTQAQAAPPVRAAA